MKPFVPGEWCRDPYAKECEQCDTVIGRYGVLVDAEGTRHVLWWPHKEWDGVAGRFRCTPHSSVSQQWRRLFEDLA